MNCEGILEHRYALITCYIHVGIGNQNSRKGVTRMKMKGENMS